MNRKVLFLALTVVALMFVFAYDADAQGCAMCKLNSKAASEEVDTSVGEQINAGILYLLAIPYVILFILFRKKIGSLFRELRTAGRE